MKPPKRKRVTEMDKLVAPLKLQCDRDWKDETPEQVVTIACNAMYWRGGPVREVLEAAIEWHDEYKRINNLCGGDPHWVTWAKEVLARPSQSNLTAVTKLEGKNGR